jgi:hypothetical protein
MHVASRDREMDQGMEWKLDTLSQLVEQGTHGGSPCARPTVSTHLAM